MYMKEIDCKYMHIKFLNVSEAIVLIIQSLIYPNFSINNEPTICNLFSQQGNNFKKMHINYEQLLNIDNLQYMLFKDVYFIILFLCFIFVFNFIVM